MADTIISLRIPDPLMRKLDALSRVTHRDPATLAEEALADYIVRQDARAAAIDKAAAVADESVFISHEKMSDWLNSWGGDDERAPPEADIVKARR